MEAIEGMQRIQMRWTGVRPLITHNGELANPRNPIVREIKKLTSKGRKKTDDDLDALRRLEWRGGLYLDERKHPCIPGDNIHACLVEGARKNKLGKDLDAAVLVAEGDFPLLYDGPKDIDKLYADDRYIDCRGVDVQGKRVQRTRPIFRKWALEIVVDFDPTIIDRARVIDAARVSGHRIGLGEYKPRYGRFLVEVLN